MEERMKEPCAEGLATHGDPKPCVGVREDADEASAGARAGRVLSREIGSVQSADVVLPSGRQYVRERDCEFAGDSVRSGRPLACVEPPCARTGRSAGRPRSDELRAATGRAQAQSRR